MPLSFNNNKKQIICRIPCQYQIILLLTKMTTSTCSELLKFRYLQTDKVNYRANIHLASKS